IVQNILINLNLKQIKKVIHPGQIALGVANGSEIMIQATNYSMYLLNNSNIKFAALNIELLNCFNMISRSKTLDLVAELLPKMYSLFYSIYGNKNYLITSNNN